MSSVSEVVNVTIEIKDAAVSQAGFGTPLIAGYHTYWPELVRTFSDADEMTVAPMKLEGVEIPWREGELPKPEGEAALAVEGGRFALAQEEVVVGDWTDDSAARLRDAALVVHDAKPIRLHVVDDTLLMAYAS